MTEFLIYIIRWAVTLMLLYSLYGLFLRRETFHGVNRAVLLAILVGSMMLPLCTIELSETSEPIARSLAHVSESSASSEAFISNSVEAIEFDSYGPTVHVSVERENLLPLYYLIWGLVAIYLIGVAVLSCRWLLAMVGVIRLINSGKRFQADGVSNNICLLSHEKVRVPCSWMRWVMVNPTDESNDPIIAHEVAHVRMLHSLDMLLAETTTVMLWFLPFAWMLRRDLKDIHEYQADRAVMLQGFNRDDYEMMLIERVMVARPRPVVNALVVNSLNQSPLKKRLKMMYRKESSQLAVLKALYILPLAFFALVVFAKPAVMSEINGNIHKSQLEIYKIVSDAPSFIPEDEKLEVTDLPAPPFSLKKEIEGNERHHLFAITNGRREQYGDEFPMLRAFNFRRVNGETYMQIFGAIDTDPETIWLGGPDTYIVDLATGIRYKARRALPPAELNRDIVVKGCKGKEFMYTIVFPELPANIKNARIYGVPYVQLRGGALIPNLMNYFEN